MRLKGRVTRWQSPSQESAIDPDRGSRKLYFNSSRLTQQGTLQPPGPTVLPGARNILQCHLLCSFVFSKWLQGGQSRMKVKVRWDLITKISGKTCSSSAFWVPSNVLSRCLSRAGLRCRRAHTDSTDCWPCQSSQKEKYYVQFNSVQVGDRA